jgi:branched-subunit amino acid transport protein
MNLWLLFLAMGAVTFATRLSAIALLGRVTLPPRVLRALRYVPIAVLSAIVVPALLAPSGALDVSPGNARLLAGLLAIAVAWRTRSIVWTIAAGMAALWALGWLLAGAH